MAKRRNADLFEVLIAQIWQDDKANVILGKSLSVLPETKLPQPVRYLMHRRPPTDLTSSVLDRQGSLSHAQTSSSMHFLDQSER